MERITSDHLIKQFRFVSFPMEGFFKDGRALDQLLLRLYARKSPLKIAGYVKPEYDMYLTRVILDIQDVPNFPFAYVYTFLEHMSEDVDNAIRGNIRKLQMEEDARQEAYHALRSPGSIVLVKRQYEWDQFATDFVGIVPRWEAGIVLDHKIHVFNPENKQTYHVKVDQIFPPEIS